MQTDTEFTKVKAFIKDQIEDNDTTLTIVPLSNGFVVNQYRIRSSNNLWQLLDKKRNIVHSFVSKKLAVLAACLLSKKQNKNFNTLKFLDNKLAIYLEDQQLYEQLIERKPDNVVYEARLDRVKQSLESLNYDIKQLEKSVNLQ
jgi:hypothetical protein